MKKKIILTVLLLLTTVIYLQCGRDVSVKNTFSSSGGSGRVEYITIVANKIYIWDKEALGRQLIKTCIDNRFHEVRFSYDMGYPVEINMEVYTNETARSLGIKCCDVHYSQDMEEGYRYNARDNPEKFLMTVE